MRLSQLARRVSKTSRELIHFLESREIRNYQSSNSKLEPDHVKLVLDYFKTPSISHPDQADVNPAMIPKEESETLSLKEKKTAEPTKIESESQEPEVIRAPKMKLQGVKVVGKIELPEKPVKTSENKDPDQKSGKHSRIKEEAKETTRTHFSDKKKISGKTRSSNKRMTYLEKQRKEERKREKEKRERLRKEKERKRLHYQKNVQTKIQPDQSKKKYPTKKSRKLEKDQQEPTPVYKNPIRRFWAWLNGAYDEEI